MNGFFSNFEATVAGVLLQPGEYNGRVVLAKETNDHAANLSGAQKEGYRFANIHDQLAVVVSNDEGTGTAIHRFNTDAWARYAELPVKERKGLKADPQTGYAVDKNGNRISDPVRRQQCANIFNQFLNALEKDGEPLIKKIAGKKVTAADIIAMLPGSLLHFKVENREYQGKFRLEMTGWKKRSVPVASVVDADEGDM